jgi:hypothetical protein
MFNALRDTVNFIEPFLIRCSILIAIASAFLALVSFWNTRAAIVSAALSIAVVALMSAYAAIWLVSVTKVLESLVQGTKRTAQEECQLHDPAN